MWSNGTDPKLISICGTCVNALGETACEWATDFIPVKGWTATPTKISENQHYAETSYCVMFCPKYKYGHSKVNYGGGDIKRIVLETLIQAVEDWKALDYGRIAEKKYQGDVIRSEDLINFFNSRYFNYLVKHCTNYKPRQIRKALHVPYREVVRWR